jgi:hypothetical protein
MTSEAEALGAANDMIRATAKWLITAAAAVGAVLIAGSQLSSIGKLDVCVGASRSCLGLPIATLGAVVALGAVSYLIWRAVDILLPVGITLTELDSAWDAPKPRADVAFFKANPTQLGYARPSELELARTKAWHDLLELRKALGEATGAAQATLTEQVKQAQEDFDRFQTDVATITAVAQHEVLKSRFRQMLVPVVIAAMVTALGVLTFAWAANPPGPTAGGADLRGARLVGAVLVGADLSQADLRSADLTDADLTGARLRGANLTGVVWSHTQCPDGTNSSMHHETCVGHLST